MTDKNHDLVAVAITLLITTVNAWIRRVTAVATANSALAAAVSAATA